MAQSEVPAHEIILVQSLEQRQQCFDIRIKVFHIEQKFPIETEIDEFEDKAAHFLLRLTPSLKPIGTIRGVDFVPEKGYYKLTRLAILPEYRKYRLGRALVEALNKWAQEHGSTIHRERLLDLQQTKPAADIGPGSMNKSQSETSPPSSDPPADATVKIVCHSQLPVKGFYAKFGYQPEGEEFDEDGDPHQKMVLHLPLLPPQ